MTSTEHASKVEPDASQPPALVEAKPTEPQHVYYAPGGYLITDMDGIIQEAEPAIAVLFRTSPHRLIGKPLVTFISLGDDGDFFDRLKGLKDLQQIQEWDAFFQARDGKRMPVTVAIAAIRDANGEQKGLRWLIRDTTGHEQTRLALMQIQDELEQRVHERTKELIFTNKQLAQEIASRKQAEISLRKAHVELELRVNQRTAELATANQQLQDELVERKRAETEAARRAHEIGALHTATTALLATLELEPLLGRILDAAISAIPAAEKGLLYLIAPDTGQLEMRAASGYADARIQRFSPQSGKGYIIRAVKERQPLLIDIFPGEGEPREEEKNIGANSNQSAIIAPLGLEASVMGAISLESSTPKAFTPADLQLLVSFAATATAAIRNAQLHAEVQTLAITDSLTGIYNRRGFDELGRREIERARRFGHPLSLILVDIDHFKLINDTYGHAAGDRVLNVVAQQLSSCIREVDLIGRYGGDEFMLLLPETEMFAASEAAERIRGCVADLRVQVDDTTISVTISLGVTRVTAETMDLYLLLKRADVVLYAAKQAGRNRVEVG